MSSNLSKKPNLTGSLRKKGRKEKISCLKTLSTAFRKKKRGSPLRKGYRLGGALASACAALYAGVGVDGGELSDLNGLNGANGLACTACNALSSINFSSHFKEILSKNKIF